LRDSGEVIGPERGGGQAILVPEVHDRIIRPAVADGDGLGDVLGMDDDRVAFDLSLGVDELVILARDGEAFQRSILRFEPLAGRSPRRRR
jgi:hypothetical protein